MLALCLMLSGAYYAKNYAGIIGLGLVVPKSLQCAQILALQSQIIQVRMRKKEN